MNVQASVGSVCLDTPIMLASGYITEKPDFFLEAAKYGCAAIVTRSLKYVVPEERKRVPAPRYVVMPGEDSMLNCEWGNEFGWENWRDSWAQWVKEAGGTVVISLSGRDLQGCIKMIQAFDAVGVDAYEINISCSHSGALHGNLNVDFKHLQAVLSVVRPVTSTPVWIKLSYSPFVVQMSLAAEQMGADAIVCTNSVGPGLLIDVHSGHPKLGTHGGAGGLSGKAIFPIALRCVFEISRAVKIPVVGVGGICSAEDVIQMLMAGASAVQLYTYPALHGPASMRRISDGLSEFLACNDLGLSSIDELVGFTHSRAQGHCFEAPRPTVDEGRCVGCAKCEVACLFGGIELAGQSGRRVATISDKCISCNACVGMCPRGAITASYAR